MFMQKWVWIDQRIEKKNCQENIDKPTGIYHTRSSDGASYRQEVRMDIRKEQDPLIRLLFKYGISCLVFSYLIMLFFPRKQFIGNSIGVSRAVEIVSTEMFAWTTWWCVRVIQMTPIIKDHSSTWRVFIQSFYHNWKFYWSMIQISSFELSNIFGWLKSYKLWNG